MAAAAIWENTSTVVAIAAAVLFLLYKAVRGASCRLPPGPRPWPVVGNLLQITPVRFQCFLAWATRYGPVMSVWMGPTLNVVVSSAAAAQEMLKEKDQTLASRPLTRAAARFSRNGQDLIWADYGPHYVKVRKVCTLELFTAKRLEALRPVREDEVGAMVAALWTDCANPVTVRRYLSAMAFNNITRIVFGKRFVDDAGELDAQGREFKEVIAQGMKLGASLTMSEHIPYLRWMFPLQEEEFTKHGARRDALTKRIMEEHKVEKSDGHHFVDALQALQKQYDLSETTVIGLLWDMITAGMDTTAISVEWALAELVRHPDVQTKAQEELDQVVGPDRVVTESDFPHLPYLHALTKESLRLHPPTPLMLPHKAQSRTTLAGFDIPKGTILHCNVYAIARDPSLWPQPLQFRPERFLTSEGGQDVDIKGHDFRLLPFGSGRRVCPGAQLGIVMVELMLARLLHQFRWSGGDEVVDMAERPGVVSFMAKPLVAVATPRLKADLYRR